MSAEGGNEKEPSSITSAVAEGALSKSDSSWQSRAVCSGEEACSSSSLPIKIAELHDDLCWSIPSEVSRWIEVKRE